MAAPPLLLSFVLLAAASAVTTPPAAAAGDGCTASCDLALASYPISQDDNFTYIAQLFGVADYRNLGEYNPRNPNLDFIAAGDRVNVSFPCDCLALPTRPSVTFLAGSMRYPVARGDTYAIIAGHYKNLTTADWLQATNSYPPNNIPDSGTVNVTVNCSCGDPRVSHGYGLFMTYPLGDRETLASVAASNGFSSPEQMDLLRKYNPGMDGVTGRGIVYIPVKDRNGSYRPLKPSGLPLSF